VSIPSGGPVTDMVSVSATSDGPHRFVSVHDEGSRLVLHELGDCGAEWTRRELELAEPSAGLAVLDRFAERIVIQYPTRNELVLLIDRGPSAPVGRVDPSAPVGRVDPSAPVGRVDTSRWESRVIWRSDGQILDIAVDDFDADGFADIGFIAEQPPRYLILHGRPGDSFDPPRGALLTPNPERPPQLTTSDLDGDRLPETILAMATGRFDAAVPDHLRIYRNRRGQPADETWYEVPSIIDSAVGDLEHDRVTDVLAIGTRGAWVLAARGRGWLASPQRIFRGAFAQGLLFDIDGDSFDDAVVLDESHGRLSWRRSLGNDRFGPVRRLQVSDGTSAMISLGDELVTANAGLSAFTLVCRGSVRRSDPRRSAMSSRHG